VCDRAVEHYAAIALMKRSPNMTAAPVKAAFEKAAKEFKAA
jgi:hypothetical protein